MSEATLAPSSLETSDEPATPTIGDVFRQVGPEYRRKHSHRMSREQRQAMALIESCRTGELGTVRFCCEACGQRHAMPRSCGNRHCPACQGHKARAWLEQQLDKLLPCPYFLVTFTIPQELRKFVRSHRRESYRALLDTAAATLIELARSPKFVGPGQLGFTGVLHSWGRTLCYHPHVHFIVPGGAIHDDGQSWLASRVDFLISVHAASNLVYTLIVQSQPPRIPYRPTCPHCGGRLICTGVVLAEDVIPRERRCWHVLDTTLRGPPGNRIAISS